MERTEVRTGCIVIIGNEILSGKVRDANSPFLAIELRDLGVNVKRISVIGDDPAEIGEEIAGLSGRHDYVFTSGGIGPTHDDVTMEGIARGFGVGLVRAPDLEAFLSTRYGQGMNEAVLKMADVPEGTEIILLGGACFPAMRFRNVFIFPGIPEYLREKFTAIRERFRAGSFHLKRLFLTARESDIAATLADIAAGHPDVQIGSYPILDTPGPTVIVTVESRSPSSVGETVAALLRRLPEKSVGKIE